MKIRPLRDQVIVKLDEFSESGLVETPDAHRVGPFTGRVIAIGPGRRGKDGETVPMQVVVGQRVYYHRYTAVSLEGIVEDGKSLVIVPESDCMCELPHDLPVKTVWRGPSYWRER